MPIRVVAINNKPVANGPEAVTVVEDTPYDFIQVPHALSLSLSHTHTLAPSLSLTHTHARALSLSHTHTLTLSPPQETFNNDGEPEGTVTGDPYTLNPAPCTLHPAPCTLHPAPYTLNPKP